MKTVQAVINLPEGLYLSLSCFGLTREKIVSESRKLLALKYFQEKLLSIGKAAELSGLSKWDFIEYLSNNNVPIIDYDDDEMSREFEIAENIAEALRL
jgi:predicted HTH domain antitoxin